MPANLCLSCGACCAFYRCSFYWREASDQTPGGAPVEWTEDLTPIYRAMKGTNDARPRCIALEGEIGKAVRCVIYDRRPTPCHAFPPSYIDGTRNERCDKARAAHGLPPRQPGDWLAPAATVNDLGDRPKLDGASGRDGGAGGDHDDDDFRPDDGGDFSPDDNLRRAA